MEQLMFRYPAGRPVTGRAMAGVVGSGDLEVLIEPGASGQTEVQISTSVAGMAKVWDAVLTRVLGSATGPALTVQISDFGATPGVVRMRIEQALEDLQTEGQTKGGASSGVTSPFGRGERQHG